MAKVQPVPPGCDRIIPHLVIQGAGQAIDFYKKAFHAEEIMRMPGPDGVTVMHAELKIGPSTIFLADECPGMSNASPTKLKSTTVTLTMYVPDADKVFNQA